MDTGLVVTFVGIVVAGLAGILGVWLERDRTAPTRWAYVFTWLILIATGLKLANSIAQKAESAESEEALARVLERLVVLSERGTNPALERFVGAELDAQARSNPEVMERLKVRVEANGGDPTALRRKIVAARRAAAGLPARPSKGTKAGAGAGPSIDEALGELGVPPIVGADGEPIALPRDLGGKDEKVDDAGKTGKAGKGDKGDKADKKR
jgi:hypothetical protein